MTNYSGNCSTPQPQYEPPTIEEWRAVPGFDAYEVSDRGRVRSIDRLDAAGRKRTGRILRPGTKAFGYPFVNIRRDNQPHVFCVHRLVAWAFLGKQDSDIEVNHKDSNPQNNLVSNLEYLSHKENLQHSVRNKASLFKKIMGFNIKLLLSSGEFTVPEVMHLSKCNRYFLNRIRYGMCWFLPSLVIPSRLGKRITQKNRQRILALLKDGSFTQQEIADRFNVNHTAVYRISTGER